MSRKYFQYHENNLGSRLKEVRMSINLTQQAFAKALNTSAGYISEIESGKTIPGSNFLLSLLRVFNINLNWLLTGEGEMKKALEKYEIEEHNIEHVADQGDGEYGSARAGYPLMKKLINEAEEARSLGLSEDELLDMLMKLLEAEQIKRRRRPMPARETAQNQRIIDIVRNIIKEDIPPKGIEERRCCMKDLNDLLSPQSDNTQSIEINDD